MPETTAPKLRVVGGREVSNHEPVEVDPDPIAEALKLAAISMEFVLRGEIAKMDPPCSPQYADHLVNQNIVLKKIRAARDLWAKADRA